MNYQKETYHSLSSRERELLYFISKELSNSEIAAELFLSKNTIDSHKKNLFLKLSVTNSAGLIRRAFELSILPMDKPESLE